MLNKRPSMITRPATLPLAHFDAKVYGDISLRLFSDDAMYWDNASHYLAVGASALNVVTAVQHIAAVPDFKSILDFGSGAGRVTRWLKAAYPHASVTVADIRAEDLAFCRETFSAETWSSGLDIDVMEAPSKYDLIWVGSVITHLSSTTTKALLSKIMTWTTAGGVAAISFHGRSAFSWRNDGHYAPAELFPEIEMDYQKTGYGYSNYPGQHGYGISFCTSSWMVSAVEDLVPACRLVNLSERAWDGHHDVVCIQRIAD